MSEASTGYFLWKRKKNTEGGAKSFWERQIRKAPPGSRTRSQSRDIPCSPSSENWWCVPGWLLKLLWVQWLICALYFPLLNRSTYRSYLISILPLYVGGHVSCLCSSQVSKSRGALMRSPIQILSWCRWRDPRLWAFAVMGYKFWGMRRAFCMWKRQMDCCGQSALWYIISKDACQQFSTFPYGCYTSHLGFVTCFDQ